MPDVRGADRKSPAIVRREVKHPWRTRNHSAYLERVEALRKERERAEYERRHCAPVVRPVWR